MECPTALDQNLTTRYGGCQKIPRDLTRQVRESTIAAADDSQTRVSRSSWRPHNVSALDFRFVASLAQEGNDHRFMNTNPDGTSQQAVRVEDVMGGEFLRSRLGFLVSSELFRFRE
ncbi:hypothetical protein RRG08_044295 [Elysia crispata]|uniref:Uncharacterized protein n=1 Tax=Elysia crispata TaxID=231223 RepID=A0AAE0XXC6_9GAST|nr:hypothetical protein RRG08_044295 [Elysia crispata]